MDTATHVKNSERAGKLQKENEEKLNKAREAALNCTSAAYTTYYFSESLESYEYHISDMYSAGGVVGTKNHSRRFPLLLLPHMYSVVKNQVLNYILSNDIPFGYLADKMTVKHRSRHMVGMRIPIFDLKYSGIVKDIFMQSSPIQELDGLGVTNHILDSFEAFGLPLTYQHNNASGMAMDGQYTKLNVETHMRDILVKDINLSWDPAHRIERAYEDSDDVFINKVINTIQNVMKKISCGKTYETLLEFKNLSEVFYMPKNFQIYEVHFP